MGLGRSSDEIVPPRGCSLGHSSHERLKNGRRSEEWWGSVGVSTELIPVVRDRQKFENKTIVKQNYFKALLQTNHVSTNQKLGQTRHVL